MNAPLVCATGPPKAKRAPAKSALPKLRLHRAYYFAPIVQARCFVRLLRLLQWPFGWVFWILEQRIARFVDEMERRRT